MSGVRIRLSLLFVGTWISMISNFCQADEILLLQAFDSYLKDVVKQDLVDISIVLSRAEYYDDGSVKTMDTLGFKKELNETSHDFDLSALSADTIKKLVKQGKDNGLLVSLKQTVPVDEEKNSTTFDTEVLEHLDTAAANIVLDDDGPVEGLQEEIWSTLYLANKVATIELLQYFDGEKIKSNTSTVIHPKRVVELASYNMTPIMKQTAAELLKKSYKVDIENRAPVIAELFDRRFKQYKWEVLTNVSGYIITRDVLIKLKIENDTYVITGLTKK